MATSPVPVHTSAEFMEAEVVVNDGPVEFPRDLGTSYAAGPLHARWTYQPRAGAFVLRLAHDAETLDGHRLSHIGRHQEFVLSAEQVGAIFAAWRGLVDLVETTCEQCGIDLRDHVLDADGAVTHDPAALEPIPTHPIRAGHLPGCSYGRGAMPCDCGRYAEGV